MQPLTTGDPTMVGRYTLLGRLGSGGMGVVYQGRSPGGRLVAVKLVRADLARDPEFRIRFTRELQAARLVGGHHTAGVVDADPDADPPWLVTSYIDRRFAVLDGDGTHTEALEPSEHLVEGHGRQPARRSATAHAFAPVKSREIATPGSLERGKRPRRPGRACPRRNRCAGTAPRWVTVPVRRVRRDWA
jgi:hypothetical protein